MAMQDVGACTNAVVRLGLEKISVEVGWEW